MKKLLDEYSVKPTQLFKRIFVVYYFAYIPFLILQIILNVTEIIPVNYNDSKIYGIKAVVIMILFSPLVVFLFAVMTWINFNIGCFIMKIFRRLFYA
ncbi:hypothetical protein Q765_11295 [Flavobacterium rivuli WB 3.3-2 = DSM 21788]|uniref:Uncharacterized protein n=1 Tax=Flavobacterium rivuli WB 3.3-2 = DSM 21788 TaxID=1121895 RepID=A0A0A2M4B3_9FLAO|nr:hypothetical protein [Flavobacterium rivuli]KGO86456.1 hypothetical protein Q765_11295 [Flavobacterium rivuli WB 3.3-2 = DSM 21788]